MKRREPARNQEAPTGARDLARLERQWDRLGRDDPFWAVLSRPGKKGNRWDQDEFFATGVRLVDAIMERLQALGAAPAAGSALDFGCGVGRITQALAPHFEAVVGVDVAPSMIREAQRLDRNPGKVTYVHNAAPDLGSFADNSFNFVISQVTLQHIRPDLALRYFEELLRVLNQGGVAVIQVPSRTSATPAGVMTRLLPSVMRSKIRGMDMHCVPRAKIEAVIRRAGATLVSVENDGAAGPRWVSLRYTVKI